MLGSFAGRRTPPGRRRVERGVKNVRACERRPFLDPPATFEPSLQIRPNKFVVVEVRVSQINAIYFL